MAGQNQLPVNVTIGVVDRISKSLDKIKAKFPELQKTVDSTRANFNFLTDSTKGVKDQMDRFAKSVVPTLNGVGKAFTLGVTLPVVAGAGYSVKKFMDFETALNDVQGATDLSGQALKGFGQQIIGISRNTTFSQTELLGLAAAAGEAGVRGSDNLSKFSLTLAQLQKTANLAGPETAESLYKILSLTKEGVGSVGQFGSALTAIENQYGVKASKVLESTEKMTREISKFGLSSTQIAGIAAAIAPLGFEAKQASTAVGDAFRGIDDAIRQGGVKMQGLQAITGMTAEQLKKDFKDKPEKVFEAFLVGLNQLEQKGGKTSEALAFFGASGDKTGVILTGLAKDTSKLAEIQAFAGAEFAKNTALTDEYNETTTTLKASLEKFKNQTDALSVTLGAQLAPVVMAAANAMGGLIGWFNDHPVVAAFAGAIAGFLAIIGPTLLGIGSMISAVKNIITVLPLLGSLWTWVAGVQWAALLPWIAIAAGIVALIAVIWIFRDAIWKGVVVAFDWVIEKGMKLLDIMKQVANVLTLGAFQKDGVLGKFLNGGFPGMSGGNSGTSTTDQASIAPEQMATKAFADAQSSQFNVQTNNARVDINVRAPQQTSITSESQGGLSINRGFAGAF